MFLDVYDKPNQLLEKQKQELLEHLKIHGKNYPLEKYEKI